MQTMDRRRDAGVHLVRSRRAACFLAVTSLGASAPRVARAAPSREESSREESPREESSREKSSREESSREESSPDAGPSSERTVHLEERRYILRLVRDADGAEAGITVCASPCTTTAPTGVPYRLVIGDHATRPFVLEPGDPVRLVFHWHTPWHWIGVAVGWTGVGVATVLPFVFPVLLHSLAVDGGAHEAQPLDTNAIGWEIGVGLTMAVAGFTLALLTSQPVAGTRSYDPDADAWLRRADGPERMAFPRVGSSAAGIASPVVRF